MFGPLKILKLFRFYNCSRHAFRMKSIRHDNGKCTEGTVNEEEVKKFRALASNWWDKNGELKALHAMNPLRVAFIRDGLKRTGAITPEAVDGPLPLKGQKILDVGCGGGILTEALAMLGATVTGLDPGHDVINVARYHSSQNPTIKDNIDYLCGTIEEISKTNVKYDAVVASEVVEHVDNLNQFLMHCIELVKDNGFLYFTTINRTWASYIFAIIAAEWILRIVPRGTHQWEKFIKPSEIQQILENNGCSIRRLHGTIYDPVRNRWLWASGGEANYALEATKIPPHRSASG